MYNFIGQIEPQSHGEHKGESAMVDKQGEEAPSDDTYQPDLIGRILDLFSAAFGMTDLKENLSLWDIGLRVALVIILLTILVILILSAFGLRY